MDTLKTAIEAVCPYVYINRTPDNYGTYEFDVELVPGMVLESPSPDVYVTYSGGTTATVSAPGWYVRYHAG